MKTIWQTKRLGDVCEIKPPKSEARKTLGASDLVSFVPMEDLGIFTKRFNTQHERKLKDVAGSYTYFANGDVLMAKITPCFENGKIGIANDLKNGIGFGSSEYFVFRSKGEIYSDYLYYFLSTDDFREKGRKVMSGAVGHKRVPKEFIEDYEIPVPSTEEQKRIVKLLDDVFEEVTKARQSAEKNLQNSKELFESYLQSVFANPGKDWEEKKLGDCFKLKSGDNLTSKLMGIDGKFSVFGGNGIAGMHNDFNLSGSNVIIGRVGALCGNVRHITEKIWLTDNAFKVVDFQYEFDHSFLTYLLNFKHLRKSARQAAQPVISNSSLKDVILQFPKSLSEQKTIAKKFDTLSAETKKLEKIYEQKLADLEELKKSILSKAFHAELS